MEEKNTFAELMDGELHQLYFIDGSTFKIQMCKIFRKENYYYQIINNIPRDNVYFIIECYDKNGRNKIVTWDGYKSIGCEKKDLNNTSVLYRYNFKTFTVCTNKEDAYDKCCESIRKRQRLLNANLLKLRKSFGLIECKTCSQKISFVK